MGDEKRRRIDDALSSLVDSLVPYSQDEKSSLEEDQPRHAFELAKKILERYLVSMLFSVFADRSTSHTAPVVVSDVNHASNLIKKKRILVFPTFADFLPRRLTLSSTPPE